MATAIPGIVPRLPRRPRQTARSAAPRLGGHERYDISRSVFVNAGLIALVCLILLSFREVRERPETGRVLTSGALAWLSHLLLDSCYGHGKGIAIFWPFSQARLNLPIPWFETVHVPLPQVDAHSLRVWGIEFVSYGLVLALAVVVRCLHGRRIGSVRPW